MKFRNPICVLFILLLFCCSFPLFAETHSTQQMRPPILFEPNSGQEDASVKYFARGPASKTLLSADSVRFYFRNENGSLSEFQVELEGSHSDRVVKRVGPAKSRVNYYIGNDESKWKTEVPAFGAAIYEGVYPGIDWLFYENEGLVEFDFVVSPGSDASQIRMNLKGVDRVSIDSTGDVVVSIQEKEFRMLAPTVYQCETYQSAECIGRAQIKAEYKLAANNKIEFELGSYDRNKTLIIDPKISFGTLLGGNTFDSATDVAVDMKGNFYVVGYTEANTRIPGNGDGYVHKFSPTGALIWSTFLVGSAGEGVSSIAVNPAGICFVGGGTSSRDFPIAGAFQPTFGGSGDGFIVKLAANGTIMRSSFIGGSGADGVTGVRLGKGSKMTNGLYLFGTTDSRNFPRKNATQSQFGGGRQDGFLTIVHSVQFQQVFSSYVGRNGSDQITSLALNTQRGDLYLMALSLDNTEGSYMLHLTPKMENRVKKSQPDDLITLYAIALYLKLSNWLLQDPGFIKFAFVSVLGGAPVSTADLGSYNAAPSIVLTTICPRPSANTPCFDNGSLTFFDQDLNRQGSMNFGGTGPGFFAINDVTAGKDGTLYFVGDTLLKNLPLVNPVQTQHKGGYEAFVLSLAPGTFQPKFYSYLGGPAFDFASAVAVDNSGNIFVAGNTGSKHFPTTPGAPKRTVTGTTDGYVIKITP